MSKVDSKQLINKKKINILLIILFAFALYCSLIIGETWDHADNLIRGKITLDYLFSFGNINNGIAFREYYSTIYWSFLHLVTKQFPLQYEVQITHFINLVFSISTIIAIGKVSGELFNKKIGKITLIVLFFYPIFFGHMGINTKDTILAFSHVWITYLLFRYIKKQKFITKRNKYVVFIPILAAMGTGIQLVFLGSLIPILIFILADILIFKKITSKNFNIKKFLYDLIKSFLIFYFLLALFWIDTHSNILILPFSIILETLSENYLTGWPYNLINGSYYLSNFVPKYYLLINLFYKSPEYFLLCYFIFAIIIFSSKKFFNQNIAFFNYRICLLFLILFFPNLIFFLVPFPLYDGMRLFLWTLPYFCIIPGIVIYFLIENYKNIKSKITLIILSTFIIYFLANFLSISPYQYTYLNFFNGKKEDRYKKFENDYWGSSIADLVESFAFNKNTKLIFGTCGINNKILESALKKNGYTDFFITDSKNAQYIVMTNRVIKDENAKNNLKLTNCFDKFDGVEVFNIKRNGLLLSTLRKKN